MHLPLATDNQESALIILYFIILCFIILLSHLYFQLCILRIIIGSICSIKLSITDHAHICPCGHLHLCNIILQSLYPVRPHDMKLGHHMSLLQHATLPALGSASKPLGFTLYSLPTSPWSELGAKVAQWLAGTAWRASLQWLSIIMLTTHQKQRSWLQLFSWLLVHVSFSHKYLKHNRILVHITSASYQLVDLLWHQKYVSRACHTSALS